MDSRTRFLLGKMVGLLGSDHDGEVIAAARKIRSLLESKKLSFGDLVALVTGELPAYALEPVNELALMAESILENSAMMRDHEIRFVQDIRARARARPKFRMTEKQASWFSYLYARFS